MSWLSPPSFLIVLGIFVPLEALASGYAGVDTSGSRVEVLNGTVAMHNALGAFIIDSKKREVRIIDHTRGQYAEASVEELCEAVLLATSSNPNTPTKLSEATGYLRSTRPVVNVPSNTSTTVLESGQWMALEEQPDRGIEIEERGPSDEIAGYPTRRYLVRRFGVPQLDVWIAETRAFTRMLAKFDARVVQRLERCGLGPAAVDYELVGPKKIVEASAQYIELMKRGWIMKRKNLENGEVIFEMRSFGPAPVSAASFEAPPGYREISMTRLVETVVAGMD